MNSSATTVIKSLYMGCGSSKNKRVKASSIKDFKQLELDNVSLLELQDHYGSLKHNRRSSNDIDPWYIENSKESEDRNFNVSKKSPSKNASVKNSRTSLHKIKASRTSLQKIKPVKALPAKKFKSKKKLGENSKIISLRNDDCWIVHKKTLTPKPNRSGKIMQQ